VTFGYGSAGTHGFHRTGVRDRWHNGKGHSDFLTPEFCKEYWVPFLRDGKIIDNDENDEKDARTPWQVDASINALLALIFGIDLGRLA
jgi:hypothetical protein